MKYTEECHKYKEITNSWIYDVNGMLNHFQFPTYKTLSNWFLCLTLGCIIFSDTRCTISCKSGLDDDVLHKIKQ